MWRVQQRLFSGFVFVVVKCCCWLAVVMNQSTSNGELGWCCSAVWRWQQYGDGMLTVGTREWVGVKRSVNWILDELCVRPEVIDYSECRLVFYGKLFCIGRGISWHCFVCKRVDSRMHCLMVTCVLSPHPCYQSEIDVHLCKILMLDCHFCLLTRQPNCVPCCWAGNILLSASRFIPAGMMRSIEEMFPLVSAFVESSSCAGVDHLFRGLCIPFTLCIYFCSRFHHFHSSARRIRHHPNNSRIVSEHS